MRKLILLLLFISTKSFALNYIEAKEFSLDIIRKHEGFRSERYKCPSGHTTIGYGLTGHYIKGITVITELEADSIISEIYDDLYMRIEKKVCLPQHQMAALVSLAYNLGITRLLNSSIIKDIKNDDFNPCDLFKYTYGTINGNKVKLKGLEKRREDEYKLFNFYRFRKNYSC